MLLRGSPVGSFAGTDGDDNADVAAGPFVQEGFVESGGRGVVFPCAFVEEDGLADLDGFEC